MLEKGVRIKVEVQYLFPTVRAEILFIIDYPNMILVDKFLTLDNFLQAFANFAAKQDSAGVDDETI